MLKSNNSCCSCDTNCCGDSNDVNVEVNKKSIVIDFLYLDVTVCERCQGTDKNLDEAILEVSNVLNAAGIDVIVNKTNINTEELARKYEFLTSPTIRINGVDIQMDYKESLCESCGDLCGDDVDCRVWVYQGKEYTKPPKAMIIDSILREVYGKNNTEKAIHEYTIPGNLKKYYAAMKTKK